MPPASRLGGMAHLTCIEVLGVTCQVERMCVGDHLSRALVGCPQVRQLCEAMGEEVQVSSYERFTSLTVEADGLQGGYRNVQPGDCIVAFSRKSIFAIKQVHHASLVSRRAT